MVKLGIALSVLLLSLFSVLPAHAVEIRITKDCQSAKRAYDGMIELGFNELLNDAKAGNYSDFVEWKKTELYPMMRAYSQSFPAALYQAGEMENYTRAVMTVNYRLENFVNFYRLLRQLPEGSTQKDQIKSALQYHLNMMQENETKYQAECVVG